MNKISDIECTVRRNFNSVMDLGDYVNRRKREKSSIVADDNDEWYGGSFEQAYKESQTGSSTRVAELREHIDALNLALTMNRRALKPDVEGQILDIAAYLSGQPECFRRIESKPDAPAVKIAVDNAISYHAKADEIYNRCAAILALVDRLQAAGRRIDLEVQHRMKIREINAVLEISTKIKLDPIDLSELAFILSPLCIRRIDFCLIEIFACRDYVDGSGYCKRLIAPKGPAIIMNSDVFSPNWLESYATPQLAARHVENVIDQFNAAGPEAIVEG